MIFLKLWTISFSKNRKFYHAEKSKPILLWNLQDITLNDQYRFSCTRISLQSLLHYISILFCYPLTHSERVVCKCSQLFGSGISHCGIFSVESFKPPFTLKKVIIDTVQHLKCSENVTINWIHYNLLIHIKCWLLSQLPGLVFGNVFAILYDSM